MIAVIPAAGIGTRLRPLTNSLPKILLNVAGKPMVSYLIDDLLKLPEIEKIILIIGYLAEKVEAFIFQSYSSERNRITFVRQQEMLGLGHAVYQAKDFLKNEPILIVLGDTIFEFDFKNFVESDYSAIGVKDVTDPSKYGIIETDGEFITKMIEKPEGEHVTKSRKAIGGVYLIKDSSKLVRSLEHIIANNILTKNEIQLTDALQHMLAGGEKFSVFEITNWFDCGNPQSLLLTNEYMLKKNNVITDVSGYPDMNIVLPSYIGKDCIIENSTIGPFTTIADGAIIRNSKVERSIIHDGAKVKDAFLEKSIIGPKVAVTGEHKNFYAAD